MSLGVVNVEKEILHGLTAKQLIEWSAYASLEPFGDVREDIRHARMMQLMHNLNVAKKDQKPLKDFLLTFEEQSDAPPPRKQGPREHAILARMIVAAYNAPGVNVD